MLTGIPLRTWAVYGIWLTLGVFTYLSYGRRSAVRLRASTTFT
jgi:hypothetical protein